MAERITMLSRTKDTLRTTWERARSSKSARTIGAVAFAGSMFAGAAGVIAHESEPVKPAVAVDCGDIDVCEPGNPEITSPPKAETTTTEGVTTTTEGITTTTEGVTTTTEGITTTTEGVTTTTEGTPPTHEGPRPTVPTPGKANPTT